MMTEKEAIELFEKAHTLQEQWNLENDIRDIGRVLSQNPIDMYQVRVKIKKVNDEHPENIFLNHIIFPPQGNSYLGGRIPEQNLIDDLIWKHIYLQAKKPERLLTNSVKQ